MSHRTQGRIFIRHLLVRLWGGGRFETLISPHIEFNDRFWFWLVRGRSDEEEEVTRRKERRGGRSDDKKKMKKKYVKMSNLLEDSSLTTSVLFNHYSENLRYELSQSYK